MSSEADASEADAMLRHAPGRVRAACRAGCTRLKRLCRLAGAAWGTRQAETASEGTPSASAMLKASMAKEVVHQQPPPARLCLL